MSGIIGLIIAYGDFQTGTPMNNQVDVREITPYNPTKINIILVHKVMASKHDGKDYVFILKADKKKTPMENVLRIDKRIRVLLDWIIAVGDGAK